MRDSTIIYRSFYEAIVGLPAENQAEVWQAIFEYSLNFKELDLKGLSKTIFTLIKPQLDANIKRYKSGILPKTKQKGSETEAKQKRNKSETQANVNDNENKNDNKIQFEIFWKKYPNKTGKKAAKAKFIKLPASDIEKIMATIDAFVAHKPFPTYNHPHATTYLNGERWNDEVPADPSAPPLLKQKPADTSSWSEYDHLCWDVSFTPSLLKDYNCARDCLGNTTEAEKRGIYKRFFNQDTLELIDIFIKR